MADNEQKNSASLGGLFVEFGLKGLGGLIKGLNSVSATFLLTKNAGQQMLQPLANMSKQAGKSVVALDKLNSVTGISVGQLQALKQWSTLNNIDFNDYIGQVHTLQNALMDLSLGNPGQLTNIATMLDINPMDLNPTKPLESMKKIENAIRRIYQVGNEESKLKASTALRLLGLNEELAYSYTRANKQIDKSLLLTDKQIDKLREQQESWNGLKVASGSFFNKLMSNAGIFKNFIDGATKAFKDLVAFIDANKEKKIDIIINTIHKTLDEISNVITDEEKHKKFREQNKKLILNPQSYLLQFATKTAGQFFLGERRYQNNKNSNINTPNVLLPNSNNISNLTNKNNINNVNYDITINQEITGNDMNEIAYNVLDSTQKSLVQVVTGSNIV